jgi:hypothetical protein
VRAGGGLSMIVCFYPATSPVLFLAAGPESLERRFLVLGITNIAKMLICSQNYKKSCRHPGEKICTA